MSLSVWFWFATSAVFTFSVLSLFCVVLFPFESKNKKSKLKLLLVSSVVTSLTLLASDIIFFVYVTIYLLSLKKQIIKLIKLESIVDRRKGLYHWRKVQMLIKSLIINVFTVIITCNTTIIVHNRECNFAFLYKIQFKYYIFYNYFAVHTKCWVTCEFYTCCFLLTHLCKYSCN